MTNDPLGGNTSQRNVSQAGVTSMLPTLCLAAATAGLQFEPPVVMGSGDPTADPGPEHFWFPEEGAAISNSTQTLVRQIVVANVRYTMDGGTQHPTRHRTETLASYDAGKSYSSLWYDAPIAGTSSVQASAGGLITISGGPPSSRGADNRSFSLTKRLFLVGSDGKLHLNETSGVNYTGFPDDVSRLTYKSKLTRCTASTCRYDFIQAVGFSYHADESAGPDENLACFGTKDTQTFAFLSYISLRKDYPEGYEGPGENDIVAVPLGFMVVFRVKSGMPYRKAFSPDGLRWEAPEVMPFGSARPKLLAMANGSILLAGGRPGVKLWVGDPAGEHFVEHNIAAVHNAGVGGNATLQYSEAFINGSLPSPGHTESTSYTSLLQVGDPFASESYTPTYLLQYDRLAAGWASPPGAWGDRDYAFSMRFTNSED